MMMKMMRIIGMIKFIVNGKPQGKARPRFKRCGNYVSTYNPKSTAKYEK